MMDPKTISELFGIGCEVLNLTFGGGDHHHYHHTITECLTADRFCHFGGDNIELQMIGVP